MGESVRKRPAASYIIRLGYGTGGRPVKRADDLSFELTRSVLTRLAPAEVPLIDSLGLEFIEAASSPKSSDGALGFDVDQFAFAVAASSCAVAAKDYVLELARNAAAEFSKSLASESANGVVKALANSLKRKRGAPAAATPPPKGPPITLDPAQISEVRKRAYAHACGIGLPEQKAALIADAIAGSLLSA